MNPLSDDVATDLMNIDSALHGNVAARVFYTFARWHREVFGQDTPCPGLIFEPTMDSLGCPHNIQTHAYPFLIRMGAMRN